VTIPIWRLADDSGVDIEEFSSFTWYSLSR